MVLERWWWAGWCSSTRATDATAYWLEMFCWLLLRNSRSASSAGQRGARTFACHVETLDAWRGCRNLPCIGTSADVARKSACSTIAHAGLCVCILIRPHVGHLNFRFLW